MIEKIVKRKIIRRSIFFPEKSSRNPPLNPIYSQVQSHRNKNHQKNCDRLIIGFHNHFCNSTQSSCTNHPTMLFIIS